MATEIEIQKCEKNFLDDLKSGFELLEIIKKNYPTCNSFSEGIDEITMSPEIVAFFRSKNIPHEFLEYFEKEALNFDSAPRTFEEAFEMGHRIGREFFLLKKEST